MNDLKGELYSKILLDHFQHPRNAGELPGATASVEVSNPVCGDVLRIAVVLENGAIRESRFLCRGCTAAIACASLLTEKIQSQLPSNLHNITCDSLASA